MSDETPSQEKSSYVNIIELRNEIRKYKQNIEAPMSDKLGRMLLDIANKFSNLPCFNGYSFREEMVSDALLKMVKNVHRIDPDDPRSPFSYLTLTCSRCFIQRIKKEKRQREISERCSVQMFSNLVEDGQIDGNVKTNQDEVSEEELAGDVDIDAE